MIFNISCSVSVLLCFMAVCLAILAEKSHHSGKSKDCKVYIVIVRVLGVLWLLNIPVGIIAFIWGV